MSAFSNLDTNQRDPDTEEEIGILLDELGSMVMSKWEYDFLMSMADQDSYSPAQRRVVHNLYRRYVDSDE